MMNAVKKSKLQAILTTIGPVYVWMVLFLVIPLAIIVVFSFFTRGTYGNVVPDFQVNNFIELLKPMYLKVFGGSILIALVTTVICLMMGYPFAYYVAMQSPKLRNKLMMFVIVPFWTNSLIRVYAWIVLLRKEGLINHFLLSLNLIDEPLKLLYNYFGIIVGMVYTLIPFMILPLYASIEKLEKSYLEAARDLGADSRNAFLHVTLPLTMPGITAGSMLVFIPSLGYFFIPDLMGGGKQMIIGNLIKQQFLTARNWPFGSALAIVLIAMTLLLVLVYLKVFGGSKEDMEVL
jgi:spermidine/putrescine transport system permease protein